MDRAKGLNFSFDVASMSNDESEARQLLERAVEANQKLLDCVKDRETRSSTVAELFRKRYLDVLREISSLEEELKELRERNKSLVFALREAQMSSACHSQSAVHHEVHKFGPTSLLCADAKSEDAAVASQQLLQRMSSASQLRDELQEEVRRLQSTCKRAQQDRDALLRLVDAQRRDIEPLLRDADNVAKGAEMLRDVLRTHSDINHRNGDKAAGTQRMWKKLVDGLVGWSAEEKGALSRIIALMGRWNSGEDDKIKLANRGQLRTVEEAVCFYQTWNDALMDTISDFLREFDARRKGLNERISELKSYDVSDT